MFGKKNAGKNSQTSNRSRSNMETSKEASGSQTSNRSRSNVESARETSGSHESRNCSTRNSNESNSKNY